MPTFIKTGFWDKLINNNPQQAKAPKGWLNLDKLIDQVSGGGIPYKSYVAKINQNGTSNPVVTVIENTTGLTLNWTRSTVGRYTTNTIQGDVNKIVCFITNGVDGNPAFTVSSSIFLTTYVAFSNNFVFNIATIANSTNGTTVPSLGPSDNLLLNASIEIRIYP